MGVKTMHPEKPGAILRLQPIQGFLYNDFGFSLDKREILSACAPVVIIVNIESLGQTKSRIERISSDNSSGGVTKILEMFGECQKRVSDDKVPVFMNAVIEGHCSQKDVRMRRQCGRIVGKGSGENHSLLGQAVYVGRFQMFTAVAAYPVCSLGIDCDQKDIQPGLAGVIFRMKFREGQDWARTQKKKDKN